MPTTLPEALTILALRAAYAEGLRPQALLDELDARIAAWADPALFLSRPTAEATRKRAADLDAQSKKARAALPLFGIPFIVKDNIDVAGLPTTAACPDFSYLPNRSATVVERLEAAGAILVGKANLDQFATGLVGVRSPYGVPRNTFNAEIIPGGSSSGSATAVAAGLAAFSLGTDTAGSGRIPAGLNNLVGLKPTPGLVSTRGVVPACRSLDCVSIFALTADDAFSVLSCVASYDSADAYSRKMPLGALANRPAQIRFGVPMQKDRRFFGDRLSQRAFEQTLEMLSEAGATVVEVDFQPLFDVARMLYDGPWVAERYSAAHTMMEKKPDPLLPVIRTIIGATAGKTAVAVFEAQYALEAARRASEPMWSKVDALVVPTVPRAWTIDEVEADPIATNSALGTYTNFVNLLGMCALAVPVSMRGDGLPAGVTMISAGGRDAWLSSVGRWLQSIGDAPLGATKVAKPALSPLQAAAPAGFVTVAAVGAHMSGLPLNRDLLEFGGVFSGEVKTASAYRFYALAGGPPQRPGLVQVADDGASIDAELWALPAEGLGRLMMSVPQPLCIGTVDLADGRRTLGFLCESAGIVGATDITRFGGWRRYLASLAAKSSDATKSGSV